MPPARDLNKESFWRRMVREQPPSGFTVRAWCDQYRIPTASFHWWRRELRQRDRRKSKARFAPVRVVEGEVAGADGRIEIVLACGRRVRVSGRVDRQMLADVLAVLTSASSVEPEGQAC
jgi:hypothetical protein